MPTNVPEGAGRKQIQGVCAVTEYRPHLRNRLKQAFERAAFTHEISRIRPSDVARVHDIEEHARRLKARVRDYFRRNHVDLVERERQRMIDEAGAMRRDLKPFGMGEDRFDRTGSAASADRHVRQREERLMARIEQARENEWSKVMKRGGDEPPRDPGRNRGHLKVVFDRARERDR
jgi:hypothetical protein